MKERPILFQGEMVRAILAGEKTQTRRVISTRHVPLSPWGFMPDETGTGWPETVDECGDHHPAVCPYGEVGDRLWVRESWQVKGWGHLGETRVLYPADGGIAEVQVPYDDSQWEKYAARWNEQALKRGAAFNPELRDTLQWPEDRDIMPITPGIYMPRWASRLTLEVTSVRVERLQDISEQDAEAEGTARWLEESGGAFITLRRAYAALWERINGEGSWEQNPWVWVISFRKLEP